MLSLERVPVTSPGCLRTDRQYSVFGQVLMPCLAMKKSSSHVTSFVCLSHWDPGSGNLELVIFRESRIGSSICSRNWLLKSFGRRGC